MLQFAMISFRLRYKIVEINILRMDTKFWQVTNAKVFCLSSNEISTQEMPSNTNLHLLFECVLGENGLGLSKCHVQRKFCSEQKKQKREKFRA